MRDSTPELYVQLQPLCDADYQRISKTKHTPVQRVKVSQRTLLATIANYVQRLVGTDLVSLHAPYRSDSVQVPLSMSVAEFLFITNQREQAELRYSFGERRAPADAHQPPKLRGRRPDDGAAPKCTPPPTPRSAPLPAIGGGLFHSGLLLFSNSFGFLPPSLDGPPMRTALRWEIGPRVTEDTLSLRKGLEAEILGEALKK
jgi:hypothetical protein